MTPWTAARQASLSVTNSQSSLKLMPIESVMPSNHLILYCPLLLPSIFPNIRVFSNESVLHIRWQSLDASMSLQLTLFHSFLWLSYFPLCVCVCVCKYIYVCVCVCVSLSQLLYLFLSWCTFRLLSCPSYCN